MHYFCRALVLWEPFSKLRCHQLSEYLPASLTDRLKVVEEPEHLIGSLNLCLVGEELEVHLWKALEGVVGARFLKASEEVVEVRFLKALVVGVGRWIEAKGVEEERLIGVMAEVVHLIEAMAAAAVVVVHCLSMEEGV
jgi:hypothetical protein